MQNLNLYQVERRRRGGPRQAHMLLGLALLALVCLLHAGWQYWQLRDARQQLVLAEAQASEQESVLATAKAGFVEPQLDPQLPAEVAARQAENGQLQGLLNYLRVLAEQQNAGFVAPLQALAALAQLHDAWLIVDDAHGFGVLGEAGRGTLEALNLRCDRLVLIGTLGKAAGVSGAFVAAHGDIVEYLIQAARPYIFTTACPPAVACAVLASLGLIAGPEGVARRAQLRRLQAHFQQGMRALLAARPQLRWQLLDSPTPIQGVVVGENEAAMCLSQALDRAGIRVPGIRPPTVPVGQARLRITLCATHTVADIDRLLNALEDAA